MNNSISECIPYLTFDGNCEEALNFYSKILDGKVTIQSRYDNPAMRAPKEFQNKVLHASLEFGKHIILACDVIPGHTVSRGSLDISISLTVTNPDEGRKIMEQLADGGVVHVPYEKQFWGAWHGNLKDKFGIKWMMNCN
jgi:PhnB protein